MNPIQEFINANTFPRPEKKIKLRLFCEAFHAGLHPKVQRRWPRWRVLEELERLGHRVGKDSMGVRHIVGISFDPPVSLDIIGGRICQVS